MSWIESFAYAVSRESRERKFRFFMDVIKPEPDETILDIGVNDTEYSAGDNYLEKNYPHPENITVVSHDPIKEFARRYPSITAVHADGQQLPFRENQFDISYSNAVIEHVGAQENQIAFLKESFRVARRGYFTTPNKYFPIEVHTRIPLLHFLLPKRYFDMFLRTIGKSWAAGGYMNLLSQSDLERLLDASGIQTFDIHKNRFLGIPMTFSVTWKK